MKTSVDRRWVREAVESIHADFQRSADTNLLKFDLPTVLEDQGISLYLKDESVHPSGSLKHRLARSLFLYALCNGQIPGADTPVFEASSGSTAISEAYFARLIGLREFVAVVPRGTSADKLRLIRDYGGRVEETAEDIVRHAAALAAASGGHFLDQFANAERATDWRGNNNIAKTIFQQLRRERGAGGTRTKGGLVPKWIVVGAGTGGTSATIGRYIRYQGLETRLCVVDPGGESAFFDAWSAARGRPNPSTHLFKNASSVIEGIGRPYAPVSFLPAVIDAMISVPHNASVGAMRFMHETGRYHPGASTGTNLVGAAVLLQHMLASPLSERGAVVTLLCDSGARYKTTYYQAGSEFGADRAWLTEQRREDGGPIFDEQEIERAKAAVKNMLENGDGYPLDALTKQAAESLSADARSHVLTDFAF